MSEALQKENIALQLLAMPELLSLEHATSYLVGRVRVRTPLGAAEYFQIQTFERSGPRTWHARIQVVLAVCNLYREMFPVQYQASQSPPFSIQREHEFYRLVNEKLFPLDVSDLDREPMFFWPSIPIRGNQQHDWVNGCCPFDQIQTVFKLALVLSGRKPGGWRLLGLQEEPAPPLGRVAWSLFVYACAVDETPLRWLPLAFDMTCYATGNVWLDAPPGAFFALDWSGEHVAKLLLARMQADDINHKVLALNRWLVEDPARIHMAVELWNEAAREEMWI